MLPALAALGGAGLLVLAYASLVELRWYALRRHVVPCLPPGSAPLRLLHISDLHLLRSQRRKIRFLRDLARLRPDLVVSTGDFLGDSDAVPAALEAVEPLRGRLASLFVLGSNDYYAPRFTNPLGYLKAPSGGRVKGRPNPWPELVDGLTERGWELIANRTLSVDGIDVLGLDDPHIRRDDLSLATARARPGLRLAIVHSPEPAQGLTALGYDLVLAGHTHGGQLRVPGFGAIVTNTRGLPRSWSRGVHRSGAGWVHVSAGLGTSKFAPVRFACRPETCLLELVPRS